MESALEGWLANFHARNAVVAIAAVVVLQYLWKLIQFRSKSRPPGPFPIWPVLGNLPLIGKLPYVSFYNLAQQYGDIMELKLGSTRTLVVSSPAMAKAVLKDNDNIFASRPANVFAEIIMYGYKDIGFAPYGQHWRLLRKLCVLELFSAKRLESFKGSRADELNRFVQRIFEQSKDGKPVNMQERLSSMTMNTVTQMLLSKRYFDSDNASTPEVDEIRELLVEIISIAGRLNIGDLIPFLKPFDLQGYQGRLKRFHTRLDRILDKLIEGHSKVTRGLDNYEKDFLHVMLSLPGLEEGSERIHFDTIKAIISQLIGAGSDTAAVAIEWALVELLRHPQVMQNSQDELDELVGRDRVVEEEDLPKLKYLDAVVKESLRLYPPIPLMLPHKSLAACKIEGYCIPANTILYVNAWAIHRHPSAYKDPFEYNPERFVGSEVDLKGQDFQLLPFGSGRRMCPGISLGTTMIKLSLARLLHSFKWSLPAGEKPEDMDMSEIFGLSVPKAIPLQVVATARLPTHLYAVN